MAKIIKVVSREILDSRGYPTLETSCVLDNGMVASASVPSGASTGNREALELRDNDQSRYQGRGVLKAVESVNTILSSSISGMDVFAQGDIDQKLLNIDGTENKSKLGSNSILSVSVAICKAASMALQKPFYSYIRDLSTIAGISLGDYRVPCPIFNVINGGVHGAGNLDFQEYFIIPATSKRYNQALQIGVEIYYSIKSTLERKGVNHSVGDEGGFAPNLFSNADALEIMVESVRLSPYELGRDVFLGLDVASSVFFKNGSYTIKDKPNPLNESALIDYYKALNDQYHFAVLEDPLAQDSWDGWKNLNLQIGGTTLLVGDDLLTTNPKYVQKAIIEKACNAVLVKPNQIGTISESLQVIKLAKAAGWKVVVSHRSGETNDWFIADFSVGVGSDYVKFGAPARGERVAKYNRLSAIDADISAHGS